LKNNSRLHPKGVIFDLGSTLIEYDVMPWPELAALGILEMRRRLSVDHPDLPSEGDFIDLITRIKTEYRLESNATLKEWNMTDVMARVCQELSLPNHEEMHGSLFDAYYAPTDERLYRYDDTPDVLAKLKEQGIAIGLVSNTIFPERTHRGELSRFGISQYFDNLIFSSTFGWKKPDPRIFKAAADGIGLSPQDCVYVGDRYLEDIVGPSLIGMPAILKNKDRVEYPSPLPSDTRMIQTLSGIFDHLEIG
jgi:putative hydrolase of the HAD superfamily